MEELVMHTCKNLMNKDFKCLYPDSTVEEAVAMLRTDDSNPDGVFVVESRFSKKLVGSISMYETATMPSIASVAWRRKQYWAVAFLRCCPS